MGGQTKLCCELTPYFSKGPKKYCRTCLKDTVRKALEKSVDWKEVPPQIADAQRAFLDNAGHKDSWQEVFENKYGYADTAAALFDKIWGDEEVEDDVVDEIWAIYDEFIDKAASHVKVVVE